MPMKTIHCKVCGKAISGVDFPTRMKKFRNHYKKEHPYIWRRSIKRGVAKRELRKRKKR